MEKITTVGIDLPENVSSLHGVDANGKAVLKRTVFIPREQPGDWLLFLIGQAK